jgi:hypothetical protein
MKESFTKELKHFSVETGKLHVPCPYREETGIRIHVVVKDGICYRSENCMVFWCKYNRLKYDVDSILSFIW